MPVSKKHIALHAIDKSLALLRSVQVLEGTDKDSVEHWLEIAVEKIAAENLTVPRESDLLTYPEGSDH